MVQLRSYQILSDPRAAWASAISQSEQREEAGSLGNMAIAEQIVAAAAKRTDTARLLIRFFLVRSGDCVQKLPGLLPEVY